ncbi:MAG: SAM-dependent chlorinase/fluorinase [Deltaproteobacteria bacterium]|nr:SAM-dependent chlorinase/fluorinase [Deltaproteobacteria bacterium]MBW2067658.1 SAM-dependent chlorinase/fluorinase [Deltaproteobacteria bacterium]
MNRKRPLNPVICFLTDFGHKDGYVAAMKGVILTKYSKARFVDISHDIDPFRIESAAYILKSVFPFFPEGTMFVVVVDPGVGTTRKPVVIRANGKLLVGPDNGVFSWILKDYPFEAREISNRSLLRPEISSTFHGRDIFAPVAAHLLSGITLEEVGPLISPIESPWVRPDIHDNGEIIGKVVHIDRFGNCITNIEKPLGTEKGVVLLPNGIEVYLKKTYSDVPNKAPLALWGSCNHLEISLNKGNASKQFGISIGDNVLFKPSHFTVDT